jgi:hypothetical protein
MTCRAAVEGDDREGMDAPGSECDDNRFRAPGEVISRTGH